MAKEDKEKTAFIISQGIFCYSKMPFGLKNVGATYQHLVDKAFQKQIGQNLEAYVDDLVIKSCTKQEIIQDVEETFRTLKKINMKLNPKKFTFGMKEDVFLGYKVNSDGLTVCPDKVEAVLSLPSPKCLKDVQRLNGKLASLNRIAYDGRATRKRRINHLLGGGKRGHQCCPDDGEGREANTHLFRQPSTARFDATNNEAEYESLIAGLKIAKQIGVQNLHANVDSRLVANQVKGTYVAKENDMIRYLEKVKTLTGSFKVFSIKQVPRSENKKADALSKIASTSFAHLSKQVLVEELKEKSINTAEVLAVVEEEGDTWMTSIFKYLLDGTLPAEGKKARAVKRKSWRMHAGIRSVVAKALRIGYYWPTTHEDSRKLIQACKDCQVHKPVSRNPQQKLSTITSSWPFYKWGIDIARPFLEGPGKVKFLIVAIDYFTKWIEAKPVATITGSQIKKFVWDNIVCRFGLPGEIISDNEKQFQDNPFKDWCEKLCIRQHFASVKHSKTNGLVERANRSLGEEIKARLDERSKTGWKNFFMSYGRTVQ
ncbi:reverse transcriptase domain-containing protein [Tanacetum coccineum]